MRTYIGLFWLQLQSYSETGLLLRYSLITKIGHIDNNSNNNISNTLDEAICCNLTFRLNCIVRKLKRTEQVKNVTR